MASPGATFKLKLNKGNKMATVTVGCKLPNGLILELSDNSGSTKKVHIKGANASELVGGHGITHDVDKEFMDAWMAKNKDLSFVKNGFLFVHGKADSAVAEAKEKAKEKTGAEPLPRMKDGSSNDKAGGLASVSQS